MPGRVPRRSQNRRRFVDDEADESPDEGPSQRTQKSTQRNRASRNATRMEESESEDDYDSDPNPRKRANRSRNSAANESTTERRGRAASEDQKKIAGNVIHYLLLLAGKSQAPILRTQIIKNCLGNDAKTRGFKQIMSLANEYLNDVGLFCL